MRDTRFGEFPRGQPRALQQWAGRSGTDQTSEAGHGEGNARLHTASVSLVTDAECAAAYGSAFDPYTMLCAGSPIAGATQYDSGGPLLVDGRLTGLISWGEGTARPGFPDVYTRLTGIEF
nr:trypsin-like serine protease [Nocardia abscessus]